MLIIYIAALLGIFRFRCLSYWKWVGFLFLWMFGAGFLFQAGGTLEDPSGDGLIARQIRIATGDGPGMAVFAIAFLVAYWGGAIWMIRKAYIAGKRFEEEEGDRQYREGGDIEPVSIERKALEAVGLTVIACGYLYFMFIRPHFEARGMNPLVRAASPSQTEPSDPIVRLLATEVEQVNRDVPRKIDSITTLTGTSAEGRILTFHYDVSRSGVPEEGLRQLIRKDAISASCKNADMMNMMKHNGVTYRFEYFFLDTKAPVSFDATIAECRSLGLAG